MNEGVFIETFWSRRFRHWIALLVTLSLFFSLLSLVIALSYWIITTFSFSCLFSSQFKLIKKSKQWNCISYNLIWKIIMNVCSDRLIRRKGFCIYISNYKILKSFQNVWRTMKTPHFWWTSIVNRIFHQHWRLIFFSFFVQWTLLFIVCVTDFSFRYGYANFLSKSEIWK